MNIYTLTGELVVDKLTETSPGRITWCGCNKNNVPVSTGIYYYVIQDKSGSTILKGKVLVLISDITFINKCESFF